MSLGGMGGGCSACCCRSSRRASGSSASSILALGYCALSSLGGGGGMLGGGGGTAPATQGEVDADRPNSSACSPACSVRPSRCGAEIVPAGGRDLSRRRRWSPTPRQPIGLRRGAVGDGAVLLPDRPEHLHRPDLLRRAEPRASARRATSPRPMSSPTRSATMSRTSTGTLTRSAARSRQHGEATSCRSRIELQADCYAGVWARSAIAALLEPGDVEEGMRAAEAIGDDTLQRQARAWSCRKASPTARRRSAWRRCSRGLQTGNPAQCNYAAVKRSHSSETAEIGTRAADRPCSTRRERSESDPALLRSRAR